MKIQIDPIEYIPEGWALAIGRRAPWNRRIQLRVPKRVALWFAKSPKPPNPTGWRGGDS